MEVAKTIDEKKMADQVKKGLGLPPYDSPMNPCVGDGIFHNAFKKDFGMELWDAAKLLGLDKRHEEFQAAKRELSERFR